MNLLLQVAIVIQPTRLYALLYGEDAIFLLIFFFYLH